MTGRRRRSGGRPARAPLPPGQLRLDIFLPGLMKEYHDRVIEALRELAMEKGCGASFRVEEIAARAGLGSERATVKRVLERLRAWGFVRKRRGERYLLRDFLLEDCWRLAGAVIRARLEAEEAAAQPAGRGRAPGA